QQLLEQLPCVAAEALQVDSASVFLLEANRLDFRVASGVGPVLGEAIGDHVPNRPDTLPGLVLALGRPVRCDDCAAERRFAVPQSWQRAGTASAMAVPLGDRGRVIGAIVARSRSAGRFGDDELRFLESMASLLATSLQ